uniref:Leucine-rich repeat-containing N-terminal plant-type domain-containing protein n=1 Tax=Arcella intermedia TaxID=1963864 RepID=A0A6B2L230_9EUKA
MKDFYDATDGVHWARGNWTFSGVDPCALNWDGVTCSSGHVILLILPKRNVSGSIPSSIGNLTKLQKLDLSFNALVSTIPSSLSTLRDLEQIRFQSNSLTGTIPPSLGLLPKLDTLLLQVNQLTGSIPSSLGSLSHLSELNLSSNSLCGGCFVMNKSVDCVLTGIELDCSCNTLPDSCLFSCSNPLICPDPTNSPSSDTSIPAPIPSSLYVTPIPPPSPSPSPSLSPSPSPSPDPVSITPITPPSPSPTPISTITLSPPTQPQPIPTPHPQPTPPPPGKCSNGAQEGLCVSGNTTLNLNNTALHFMNITNGTITIIGNLSTTSLFLTNSQLDITGSYIVQNVSIEVDGTITIKNDMRFQSGWIVYESLGSRILVYGKVDLGETVLVVDLHQQEITTGEYIVLEAPNQSIVGVPNLVFKNKDPQQCSKTTTEIHRIKVFFMPCGRDEGVPVYTIVGGVIGGLFGLICLAGSFWVWFSPRYQDIKMDHFKSLIELQKKHQRV